MTEPLFYWTTLFFAFMAVLSFSVMGADKFKAVNGKWRIRERTLLLLDFLGGGIGGLLGMLIFRHKIRHRKFLILVPLSVLVNAACWWWIVNPILATL